MAAQCDSTFCFIKRFERSPFNFCDASLQYIDAQKGRGLVAEETLEKGTVVALFPGAESHRIPQTRKWHVAQSALQFSVRSSYERA